MSLEAISLLREVRGQEARHWLWVWTGFWPLGRGNYSKAIPEELWRPWKFVQAAGFEPLSDSRTHFSQGMCTSFLFLFFWWLILFLIPPQLYSDVIDIQHCESLRCTTCWFDVFIYGKMITTMPLASNSILLHNYSLFFFFLLILYFIFFFKHLYWSIIALQ